MPTMTTPDQQVIPKSTQNMSEVEYARHTYLTLKSNTDPQKWTFIEEIRNLAEQQNNYNYSTMEAIISNSQKSIQDLFYIKYDLSLNGLIVTDLLINFRDICKFYISIIRSEEPRIGRGPAETHHIHIPQQTQPEADI